jgi:hypothetical protein
MVLIMSFWDCKVLYPTYPRPHLPVSSLNRPPILLKQTLYSLNNENIKNKILQKLSKIENQPT